MSTELSDDGLTWEQCDEFRRTPGSFNDMVQTIYRAGLAAGRARAIEECAKVCDVAAADMNGQGASRAKRSGIQYCADAIRALNAHAAREVTPREHDVLNKALMRSTTPVSPWRCSECGQENSSYATVCGRCNASFRV